MADQTPEKAEPSGPGRPPLNIGQQEIDKILELMERGLGRVTACKEAGFKHFRTFTKLMRDDPEFRDHVLAIEQARLEFAELRLYEQVTAESPDYRVIGAYINVRNTARSLVEARRARRRAEAIEDRKIALEERRVAAAEGKTNDDDKAVDIAKLSPERQALYRDLLRELDALQGDPPPP